jgi:chromate transport protein ChrA
MRGFGDALIALGLVFAPLSLLSFGGGNAVLADIAQQAIHVQGWTSEREFADLFALSRAAPGPGSMLAALIGWKAAGIAVLQASPGGPAVWIAAIATTVALLRWPGMHPVPLLLGAAALFGIIGAF